MMSNLREFQEMLRSIVGDEFATASDHHYGCTCDFCRLWWLKMGPGDGKDFGPFGNTLWKDFADELGVTVGEARKMYEE